MGLWLTTWQSAFAPQTPSQGSTHFLLVPQARCSAQSLFFRHSGRQLGGWPMKPCWHEQMQAPFTTFCTLLGPHWS